MRISLRFLPMAVVAAMPAAHAQQPAPKPDAGPPAKVESLEVTQKRTTTSERRDSTASKIVIGREEIDQYGDTNLGDVMRRLPGVTQAGRPGRGGPVRMRGMAGGYTQMLLNGERVPPGFSLEEITPDQVERIEIIRAPTAETGTRAVAGTINIVLREALRQRHNDVRLGVQSENDRQSYNASVTRNDTMGEKGSYNVTMSYNRRDLTNDGTTDTRYVDVPTGETVLSQHIAQASAQKSDGLFATARLQWQLGPGEQLSFQPFVVANNNESGTRGRLTQDAGALPAPYDTSASASESRFRSARFTSMLTRRLDPLTSVEMRLGAGQFSVDGTTNLDQFDAAGARSFQSTTVTDITDRSWNLAGKVARSWGETHRATTGFEWEQTRRRKALLAPKTAITIKMGETLVKVAAGALVVVAREADGGNVLNLSDGHAGAVCVEHKGHKAPLYIGNQFAWTTGGADFKQTPLAHIAVRNLKAEQVEGDDVYLSEFSLISALRKESLVTNLMSTSEPERKKLFTRVLTNVLLLQQLAPQGKPYSI